jgi:hypothetical protein
MTRREGTHVGSHSRQRDLGHAAVYASSKKAWSFSGVYLDPPEAEGGDL